MLQFLLIIVEMFVLVLLVDFIIELLESRVIQHFIKHTTIKLKLHKINKKRVG